MTKINFTVYFFFSLSRYRKKRQSVCIATYIGITRRTVPKQQNEAKVVWAAEA